MSKKIFLFPLIILWAMSAFGENVPTNPDSIPFAPAANYNVGGGATSVFCADLDGDVDLDIAAADYWGLFAILKNNGDGTFQTAVYYGCGALARSIFCADFDMDGDLDIVEPTFNCHSV